MSAKGQLDKVILDIDDLEAVETPESVLMAAVSSEDAKDRSDREVLTPWILFLWDAYRTVLDILRNNNRLERLYQETSISGMLPRFLSVCICIPFFPFFSFPVLREV